jgi:hypothetical protein
LFADLDLCSFYLHNPAEPEAKPVLFVPSSQFQLFLDYVNKELDIALSIPGGANADRFLVQFDSNATHRPRYLKRSRDAKELEVPEWPELSGNDLDTFNNATPLQREQFVDKLRYATAPPVKDKIQGKAKAIRNRRERENMLMAMQALLGLGTSVHGGKAEMHDVVFVSVDVEAIERPPNPISEIGLAMLDGNGIRDIEPGARGENWWPMIQAHHLRTREYSGLVNHEFVEGCPDDFDFG